MSADNLLDELMNMDHDAMVALAEAETNRLGGFKKIFAPDSELSTAFDSVGMNSHAETVYIRVNETASVDDYARFAAALSKLPKGGQESYAYAFYFCDQKFLDSYDGLFPEGTTIVSLEVCLRQAKKRGAVAS